MIKETLFTNWSFMRILRLGLGIFFAIQAIQVHDTFAGFASIILLFQAITNTGCCGARGCAVPKNKNSSEKSQEIEFEEIK